MPSLRARLLVGTAAGATAVLLVSGVLLYAFIDKAVWNEFDASLAARARSLAAVTEQEDGELELDFEEAHLPEFQPSERAEFYQVWMDGGRVRARSPSLQGRDLRCIEGPPGEPVYASVVLPDGRPGRLVGLRFTPRQEVDGSASAPPLTVTLVLGRDTAGIDGTLAQIKAVMAGVGVAAVVVALGVLAWFVRRGLKPVDRVAAQIGAVGESDLSARIPPAGIPAELLPVIDRLNDLLSRLESAFRRERRFTADVAHELRTPLAGMRSLLEVGLSRPREAEGYRQAMGECLSINSRMHRMVEILLSLARADANQLPINRDEVDLATLVEECWQPLAARADARGLRVEWRLKSPCRLESDRAKLGLVFQNLLSNAVTYANQGGCIRIESASSDERIEVILSNTGSTLSQNDAAKVFDRFWRGDTSRQSDGQHCGLGLSLSRTLVELLGGSISVESSVGGLFSVVVRLGGGTCGATPVQAQ